MPSPAASPATPEPPVFQSPGDKLCRSLFPFLAPRRDKWAVKNLPNALTVIRLGIVPTTVELYRSYHGSHFGFYWGWFVLGAFLAFTDLIDGPIARMVGNEKGMGQWLDPTIDKIFSLSLFLVIWFLLSSTMPQIADRRALMAVLLLRFSADLLLLSLPLLKRGLIIVKASPAGKIKFNLDVAMGAVALGGVPIVHAGWLSGNFVGGIVCLIALGATFYGFRSFRQHLGRKTA
jgi:phosphatidylglycerophosphate synthase